MSVRRLHSIQPDSFAFNAENLAWAKEKIAQYPAGKQASAVIPLLWRAQEQNDNWVTKPVIEYVANMLDMAYIRVLEVATFYTMFQLQPVGRIAHIQVCGTTPCMLRGAEDLKKVCQNKIHHEQHQLSEDGKFSWEEVECLGACVNAPMVQIFKDTYEDLTPASFERLIDDLAAGRKVKVGPQIDRHMAAPEGVQTALTDPSLYEGQRTFVRVEPPPPAPAAPAATGAAPAAAAPPAAAEKKDPPPAAAAPAAAPAEASPLLHAAPKDGKADELELIWGVGPKLRELLNKMGVWHFDQVASWTEKEIRWVDARLEDFKGRIERDDWIEQAKKLASGWRPANPIGDKPNK